jgi:solute carrier family 25 protein 33/36
MVSDAGFRWRHFIAGGAGGMVGATITCPLEVIKTRLQSRELANSSVWRQVGGIMKNEGIRGFWKGLGPMVVGVVPARATYFATYDGTKVIPDGDPKIHSVCKNLW